MMSAPAPAQRLEPSCPVRARDAVHRWLATAPLQAAGGPAAGGIAGVLDKTGTPAFIYGEITGYWLRWASLYASIRDGTGA